MENNPQIVAEQQYGKDLYHKLGEYSKEGLHDGKIWDRDVNLDDLPKETLTNYKIGIAFEALKEKDYKTAEVFFAQAGEKYSELKAYAEKLWLEDRTKEEQLETLVAKINTAGDYKARFNYAKERINSLAKKHEIIKNVLAGETTLEKTARLYYKELNSMCKLRKKEFKKQIKPYSTKLTDLEETLEEFINLKIEGMESLEDYKAPVKERARGIGAVAGILTTFPMGLTGFLGAIITVGGIATGDPIVIFIGIGMACGGCGGFHGGMLAYDKLSEERKPKREVRKMFRDLITICKKTDEVIHKAFITDFYSKDSEIFQTTFQKLNEEEQTYVINQLLEKKGKNQEIDDWLSKKYPELVTEVGRDRAYLENK